MYHGFSARKRHSVYSGSRSDGAPPKLDKRKVSRCQFRLNFDNDDEPHSEFVQGYSV